MRTGRVPPERSRRYLLLAVARPLLTVTVLVLVYYLIPDGRQLSPWTLVLLVVGLLVVVIVVIWEVRAILCSQHPASQGVQALALVVPLFLLLFANVYYLLALTRPGSFTASLTRTDALYFTVTVFATVGFGDIAPVTTGARVLVIVQMIGDLLVFGVALRVILAAVQQRRRVGSEPPPRGRGAR
ncbi:potassium channel family protein [Allokutzneria albata]|uniref:Ion channel n=1 Tax=Allokutzneria albata TaxID=211114 RepID=A0A1G9R6A5_ALLAB|nr:potassium channel family protein [Allokutzneria albata]SDM18758.1 Ion channel [Allokutzneria albata]